MDRRAALYFAIVAAFSVATVTAAEPAEDFLRAMRENGYGDMALVYLDRLESRRQVPADLRDTLDLERSESFRSAAKHAYSSEQARQFVARAQEHLDKFVKEHGDHPSVANAALAGADFAADQAIDKLMQARAAKDNAEQDRLLGEARQAFEACRPRYADAAKRFEAQTASLPKVPAAASAPGKRAQIANAKALSERNRVEAGLAESLLKSAIVDYQIAQTYLQPSNEDRRKALTNAAEAFDKLYRQHGNNSDIGIQAHFWKGRSLDELGDASTAIDIYDEVLVMAPEGPKASPDIAPFYAQVALSRLKLLAKQNKNKEALEDAEAWLEDHKNWNRTRAYQGVALESAKLLLADAADAKGDVKSRLTQQALALLANVGKIESEYQSEAILLRRQHAQGAAAGTSSFDELLALGDEAGRSEKWTDAKQAFAKALEFAEKQKNDQHIKTAKERLTLVEYRIALAAYTAGKLDEAYQHAMRVAAGDPSDPTSSAAAALALACAHARYAAAADKTAPLADLEKIAQSIVDRWSQRVEADEARVILAQVRHGQGNAAEALQLFMQVRPESKRYAAAQLFAGQAYWRSFLDARKAAPDDNAKLDDLRNKAIERLEAAVASQSSAEPAAARAVEEARLLLATIQMDAGRSADAVKRLDPLLNDLIRSKPKQMDTAKLRLCLAGAKAHLMGGDLAKAAQIADVLSEINTDNADINDVLVDIARLLSAETRKGDAALEEADASKNLAQGEALRKRSADLRTIESRLIQKLLPREQLQFSSLLYVADACGRLGLYSSAREQYQKILRLAEADAKFRADAKNGLTRVRAQLVGLLRDEGRFEEAVKQADELIAGHPRALEPLLVKAKILQAWAAKDPIHYDDCVGQWTKIRLLLSRTPRKPPEYYDAIYNAALCLVDQSRAIKNPEKALQAEQLLKSTLTLSPNLDGPDNVTRYNALLKRAQAAQGRSGS